MRDYIRKLSKLRNKARISVVCFFVFFVPLFFISMVADREYAPCFLVAFWILAFIQAVTFYFTWLAASRLNKKLPDITKEEPPYKSANPPISSLTLIALFAIIVVLEDSLPPGTSFEAAVVIAFAFWACANHAEKVLAVDIAVLEELDQHIRERKRGISFEEV